MKLFRTFLRDDQGVATVEFAVIVPVLAALLVGLMIAWEPATAMMRMRAAVHAGAAYVRNGGTDDVRAMSVVDLAWEKRPLTSSITVNRACLCGQASNACTVVCADRTPPSVYVTLRASETDTERALGRTLTSEEVVRVR